VSTAGPTPPTPPRPGWWLASDGRWYPPTAQPAPQAPVASEVPTAAVNQIWANPAAPGGAVPSSPWSVDQVQSRAAVAAAIPARASGSRSLLPLVGVALGLVAVAAGVFAGVRVLNGKSGSQAFLAQPPAQMLKQAIDAANATNSVHIALQTSDPSGPISVVGDVTSDAGRLDFTSGSDQVKLIKTGKTIYMQANSSMLAEFGMPPIMASSIGGRWVALQPGQPGYSDFIQLFDDSSTNSSSSLTTTGPVVNGGQTIRNGQNVVALKGTFDGTAGTIFVTTDGQHLPVEFDVGGTTVAFSNWGEPVSISPPQGALSLSSASGSS
jgi:hypothetical protein